MAFTIYLGNCTKKVNSTFQPEYAGWKSTEAVWKKPTNLENPNIELYLPGEESPKYNYLVIPAHDQYYWITGITAVGKDRWIVSAAPDLLATYKVAIMDTTCYVLYGNNLDASSSSMRVRDERQNIAMVPSVTNVKADITDASISFLTGVYILCAVGKSGGVTAYMMTAGNMRRLLNNVGRDITSAAPSDIESLLKFFTVNSLTQGSAINAIRSCTWLPLSSTRYSGDSQTVYLGDWDSGVTGKVVESGSMFIHESEVAIPWPVSDWRRMNCQILAYVPFDGTIAIPVDQCNNESILKVRWVVDLIGGSISIRINAGEYTVHTGSGNIGVPYGIGASNVPIQNFASGVISAVGGALQVGGGALGAMASLLPTGGIGNMAEGYLSGVSTAVSGYQNIAQGVMQAVTPVIQGSGTLGGSAAVGQHSTMEVTVLYYPPIDNDGFRARYGHPVMRVTKPIAGYCQTRGFSLTSAAMAEEAGRINNMMDAGVFIE